ncbi:hypothetical protein MMC11_006639 [Xylographa trunciseda]|nr:hypothetical protein [Xylographa trunciseda]
MYPFTSKSSEDKIDYSPMRESSDEGSSDELLEKEPQLQVSRRSIWKRYTPLILAHCLIFSVYLASLYFVATSFSQRRLNGPGLVYSPAREAVLYEERPFTLGDKIQEHSIYSGRPSPELDLAWHNLLNAENIRLSPSTMEHYGRSDIGVALPDGSGYVGTLNVYHELHCIKRLHQYMYSEHYFGALDAEQREMNRLHNEHCLDFLRQASICHGDIGLITFEWAANSRLPVANATSHECVNWDRLDAWTKDNSVDMFTAGLVHPTLGPAYPDGKGDSIGAAGHGTGAAGHGGHRMRR